MIAHIREVMMENDKEDDPTTVEVTPAPSPKRQTARAVGRIVVRNAVKAGLRLVAAGEDVFAVMLIFMFDVIVDLVVARHKNRHPR